MATARRTSTRLTPALLTGALTTLSLATAARAQETAAQPAPAAPEAAPAAPAVPAPETMPPPAPPPPPPVADAAAEEKRLHAAHHGENFTHPALWMRFNNVVGNGDKLNDIGLGAEVDLLTSGQVHEKIKWQANFVATLGNYGGGIAGNAAILDLIGKFEIDDAFNVWFGRMLVPSDRANFAGPWFMSPWNYPGFYVPGAPPIGPAQGPFGRNDGATAWGQFAGGMLKYYVSAFDLHDQKTSPLFSGRLNLALLNPEPGYYHSSTYYGGKDILAIGVGGQFKKDGSVQPVPMPMPGMMAPAAMMDDFQEFNADVLFEKNLGGGGTIDVEAAVYLFPGEYDPVKYHCFALVSYLTPNPIGWGHLQPLVRLQMAKERGTDKDWRLIDAQLGYAIDKYAARLALGFQNADIAGTKANSIFFGIQLQK